MTSSLRLLLVLACTFSVAAAQAASINATLTDGSGAVLQDAVVFATKLNTASPAPRNAVIDQVNKEFVPLVSVIQTGTAVTFPNKDNIRHHVYSFSAPKPFDLKLYSGVPAKPVIFDKPGVVILGCNIHDWMLAYVLVVDTPYFAKSDAKGLATIDDLSLGDYEVRAWHPRMQTAFPLQKLKVGGGDNSLRFRLELGLAPAAK